MPQINVKIPSLMKYMFLFKVLMLSASKMHVSESTVILSNLEEIIFYKTG